MKDTLSEMVEMQAKLQGILKEQIPTAPMPMGIETAGGLIDYLRLQFDAIQDEFREILVACGQDSKGKNASAAWKYWKAENLNARAVKLSDFSEVDKKALKMELVDVLHYVLNSCVAIGMDGKEMHKLYMEKNKENIERWENKY